MTNEMLLGGLMILGVVAGIVVAMTSPHTSGNDRFKGVPREGRKARRSKS